MEYLWQDPYDDLPKDYQRDFSLVNWYEPTSENKSRTIHPIRLYGKETGYGMMDSCYNLVRYEVTTTPNEWEVKTGSWRQFNMGGVNPSDGSWEVDTVKPAGPDDTLYFTHAAGAARIGGDTSFEYPNSTDSKFADVKSDITMGFKLEVYDQTTNESNVSEAMNPETVKDLITAGAYNECTTAVGETKDWWAEEKGWKLAPDLATITGALSGFSTAKDTVGKMTHWGLKKVANSENNFWLCYFKVDKALAATLGIEKLMFRSTIEITPGGKTPIESKPPATTNAEIKWRGAEPNWSVSVMSYARANLGANVTAKCGAGGSYANSSWCKGDRGIGSSASDGHALKVTSASGQESGTFTMNFRHEVTVTARAGVVDTKRGGWFECSAVVVLSSE
jgi:hypothetical protein